MTLMVSKSLATIYRVPMQYTGPSQELHRNHDRTLVLGHRRGGPLSRNRILHYGVLCRRVSDLEPTRIHCSSGTADPKRERGWQSTMQPVSFQQASTCFAHC